jgi:hypothetical protein
MHSSAAMLGFRQEEAAVPWRHDEHDVLHPHALASVQDEENG